MQVTTRINRTSRVAPTRPAAAWTWTALVLSAAETVLSVVDVDAAPALLVGEVLSRTTGLPGGNSPERWSPAVLVTLALSGSLLITYAVTLGPGLLRQLRRPPT